jgi:hypothetical protein
MFLSDRNRFLGLPSLEDRPAAISIRSFSTTQRSVFVSQYPRCDAGRDNFGIARDSFTSGVTFLNNRHAADEIFRSLLRWQVKTQVSWLGRSCVNNAVTLTKVAIAINICGPVLFISFLPRSRLNNKSRFWPLSVSATHAPRRRERLRDSTSRLQTKNCCRMPDGKSCGSP